MITKEIIEKLNSVIDAGLCSGLGDPTPGEMCVEAAVCYAFDLPHGDNPRCVHTVLQDLGILLNDKLGWSSNEARAKGLKRFAIAQLGTAENFDAAEFANRMLAYAINKKLPAALRLLGKQFPAKAADLDACALACENAQALAEMKTAVTAARDITLRIRGNAVANVYAAADAYAAVNNSFGAVWAAIAAYEAPPDPGDAEWLTYLNACAANAAYAAYGVPCACEARAVTAYAVDAAYASGAYAVTHFPGAAEATPKDAALSEIAEYAVQVLIDMGTPGSRFLQGQK